MNDSIFVKWIKYTIIDGVNIDIISVSDSDNIQVYSRWVSLIPHL